MNSPEKAARAEKASKLAMVIIRQARESDVDPVLQAENVAAWLERLPAGEWRVIAREARVNFPSEETREIVVQMIRSLKPKRLSRGRRS